MPWLRVNQTRLTAERAVPTPLLALEVQRGGMPGQPGASVTLQVLQLGGLHTEHFQLPPRRGQRECPDRPSHPDLIDGLEQHEQVRLVYHDLLILLPQSDLFLLV